MAYEDFTQGSICFKKALNHWENKGLLDLERKKALQDDIEVISFDWKRLARYSLLVSSACIVVAASSLFTENWFIKILLKIFHTSGIGKGCMLSLIAILLYWRGIVRRTRRLEGLLYTSETIFFLGVLATGGAIYYFTQAFQITRDQYINIVFPCTCILYSVLGFYLKSKLIWIFSLGTVGIWFGAQTGYLSGWGCYYFGMNYPLRFVLLGLILVAIAYPLEKLPKFQFLARSTLVMALLYGFMALWLLSIFGNIGSRAVWLKTKQIELFHWSLLFGFAACASIFHGLRFNEAITKGFGITFLFINIYTRFFEFFWDSTPKFIFFSLLGLSFWILGVYAEKIYTFGQKPKS